MKPTSLTTAIIEILDSINNSKIPADRIISFWNKNNRYAGSKDKSFITESIYNILRNKGQIEWWVKYLDCNISARTIIICYTMLMSNLITIAPVYKLNFETADSYIFHKTNIDPNNGKKRFLPDKGVHGPS